MADVGDLARRAAESAARNAYGRLLAYLARAAGSITDAEDALADAFAAAIETWPQSGIPNAPEAWILTVARNRQNDFRRRARTRCMGEQTIALLIEEAASRRDSRLFPDERLGLMFACAHPALAPSIRTPLMLQAVMGLSSERIASAFLTQPSAMAQRLVRAKHKIAEAKIPFSIPERAELPERLDAVLAAIYAVYGEGWSDLDGGAGLAEEGLWLGRLVAELMPDAAETHGLLALMLHLDARREARRNGSSAYVPLSEQDTARWDAAKIADAETLLFKAAKLNEIGRFQIEAAIQSAHVAARRQGSANARDILALYDALLALTGSSIAALNRAVALAEIEGAQAGLAILDELAPDLDTYQPYHAARAELLLRTGNLDAARGAYDSAIGLTIDPAVRQFLLHRRPA